MRNIRLVVYIKLLLLFCVNSCFAQHDQDITKLFKDKWIREWAVKNYGNKEGLVYASAVDTVTKIRLVESGQNISSLEWLKHFTALKKLGFSGYQQTEADFSILSELESLEIILSPNLRKIDISQNSKLKELNCEQNELSELDLRNNLLLELLNCKNNQLTKLDVSVNKEINAIYCSNNLSMKSIVLGKKDKLSALYLNDCFLSKLDISGCPNLTILEVIGNRLRNIDISRNTQLTHFAYYLNSGILYIDGKYYFDIICAGKEKYKLQSSDDLPWQVNGIDCTPRWARREVHRLVYE